ncbi:VIT and VWA domain-containing protein [Azohydromonas lata]|uniref:VIT and VWA domain-containing protein n=1 Tax=Azohydromonas lata TaxID=45677 RepID=A0ABU5I8H7_9BURK|nr:VIT and VWA domain-containing protein [Azohydromonas lata]MDZ5455273.1 VIT and VWA domain-containing protein [Azohydromonas lata]
MRQPAQEQEEPMKVQSTHPAASEAVASPFLLRAHAAARIEGALFETVLTQTYANTGQTPLELIYTFPLPSQAVFLGLETQLGNDLAKGVILPRRQAEQRYDVALQEGDTPVMLERAEDGLLTANLGNLAPGEELDVTLRWGQWLQVEQGRIRAVIPTVVAPRFGTPTVEPQQATAASLQAEYPLQVTLDVLGELASAEVACQTHRASMRLQAGALRLTLQGDAALDRDVVFTLQLAPEQALGRALHGRDEVAGSDHHVALAALTLPEASERGAIALRLVVDCSGSMGGDGIASARRALLRVARWLRPGDRVSYSRFGSTVAHDIAGLQVCDERELARLARHIEATDADLGGTEMEQALHSVFGLGGADAGEEADVLLITDGQVWQAEPLVEAARRSRHRVFAIGVGSAPREGLLQQLVEATGGACEFATPGESLEEAADRSLRRIRQQPWHALRIEWDVRPQTEDPLPATAFGGDTLLLQALFAGTPARQVQLLARDTRGSEVRLASVELQQSTQPEILSRSLAARRLSRLQQNAEAAVSLALAYRLLTAHTCCVLVHERAVDGKVLDPAELQAVPPMMAAGWGATSSVLASDAAVCIRACQTFRDPIAAAYYAVPPVWRSGRSAANPGTNMPDQLRAGSQDFEIPAYLRKQVPTSPQTVSATWLCDSVQRFLDALAAGAGTTAALEAAELGGVPTELEQVLQQLQSESFSRLDAWLALATWLMDQPNVTTPRWSGASLPGMLSKQGQARMERLLEVVDQHVRLMPTAAEATTTMGGRLKRFLSARHM